MPEKIMRRRRGGVFKRGKRWYGDYIREDGKRVREPLLAANYADAVNELGTKRKQAREIRETGRPSPSKASLATVLRDFLNYQQERQSAESYLRTKGIIDLYIEPAFGHLPMNTINRDMINNFVSARNVEASPGTVLKELGTLKKLFNWLHYEKGLVATNPPARLKPPRTAPSGRDNFIEQPEQVRAIVAGCPEWLRPIVGMAVYTGMRRGEILGLRWSMVNLKRGVIKLPKTKNGDPREVPLNNKAVEIIKGQHTKNAKPTGLVFSPSESGKPASADNVSKAFKAVVNRLEISDIHFHDLRRTAGSHLRMAGIDILTIADILGHRDMRTTKIYQRSDDEFRSAAISKLDSAFDGA